MEGKLLFWERNHESPNESVLTKPGFVMFRTGALIIFFCRCEALVPSLTIEDALLILTRAYVCGRARTCKNDVATTVVACLREYRSSRVPWRLGVRIRVEIPLRGKRQKKKKKIKYTHASISRLRTSLATSTAEYGRESQWPAVRRLRPTSTISMRKTLRTRETECANPRYSLCTLGASDKMRWSVIRQATGVT